MKYVILAGGCGSRLWPLSRQLFAKQFLDLVSDKTMIQETITRVSKTNGKDIYIIANGESKFIIKDQVKSILPDFPEKNLIIEPEGRNTAPAIAYGSIFFDDDDVVTILSSDHFVKDKAGFNTTLDKAEKIAQDGYIVTIGIVPDAPKTGYGYIKKSDTKIKNGFLVEKFVEKPNYLKAKEYIENHNYYWNAGIFVFKIKTFLEELKIHSPGIYNTMQELKAKKNAGENIAREDYLKFEKISIDYAIMEKTDKIVVVPSEFKWNDIGSFNSLYEVLEHDGNSNAVKMQKENFININSKNLLVCGDHRKIATINLNNLAIIDTPDALLISNKDTTEEVKTIFNYLDENNAPESHHHIKVYRPWGSYTTLYNGDDYKVKKLQVNPGKKISLQYHNRRCETWTVVKGQAEIINGDKTVILNPSETIFIPKKNHHRLINPSKTDILEVIEVQRGDYLEEDDIIRLEDDFARE